jgi:hypothetical protein
MSRLKHYVRELGTSNAHGTPYFVESRETKGGGNAPEPGEGRLGASPHVT